jgi:excisionase family DNA binding protein
MNNSTNPAPLIYDAREVAHMLGCAVTTVEERARAGELPGVKFGDGGWRFPAVALAHRVNELALEESRERRKPVAKATAVLAAVPGAGRKRTTLPMLPTV